MKCEACGSTHDVFNVGDEQKTELLCKSCISENVADFFGETADVDELTPYLVNETLGV